MTTTISKVYKAFLKAGVPEQDAVEAAEALSTKSLATKNDIARLDKKMAIMQWMLGIVIAAQMLSFFRAVTVIL